jgi:putative transcriptional regulator
MASIHETAEGLHAAGVMDKRTMRDFDDLCVTPVQPLKPMEIRALRLREGASQAVFARYLNVTTGLVSQWERGEKHPQGASLKLLALVARNGLQGECQGVLQLGHRVSQALRRWLPSHGQGTENAAGILRAR